MKNFLIKSLSNYSSFKVQVIVFASVMFCLNKLSEETWKQLIMALVVVRGASDVTAIIKEKKEKK